jgi:hypothetical protein
MSQADGRYSATTGSGSLHVRAGARHLEIRVRIIRKCRRMLRGRRPSTVTRLCVPYKKIVTSVVYIIDGAPGRTRTSTMLPPPDFESGGTRLFVFTGVFPSFRDPDFAVEIAAYRCNTLLPAYGSFRSGGDSVVTGEFI